MSENTTNKMVVPMVNNADGTKKKKTFFHELLGKVFIPKGDHDHDPQLSEFKITKKKHRQSISFLR